MSSMHTIRIADRHQRLVTYEEMPTPEPGIGDVLVKVAASSFTFTELEWPSTWVDRAGRDRTPIIPGHEVSGTVVALGYGTTGLQVGDAVYGLSDWYRDGTAADYVAVEARNLALKPGEVSHAEAASLSLAGLTAWQGLFVHGRLGNGQTVVILGAAGGVGSLTVQLAHATGASVVAVAREKAFPFLGDLGVEVLVDADAAKTSDVEGADLLFDLVGGNLVDDCVSMLRPGGVVVSIVNPDPPSKTPVDADFRFFVVEPDRSHLHQFAHLVDAGRVRPVVSHMVSLPDAAAAQLDLKAEGGAPGKVVLQPEHLD